MQPVTEASAMQRTMMIPVEMVFIVEALVLLFILLSDVIKPSAKRVGSSPGPDQQTATPRG